MQIVNGDFICLPFCLFFPLTFSPFGSLFLLANSYEFRNFSFTITITMVIEWSVVGGRFEMSAFQFSFFSISNYLFISSCLFLILIASYFRLLVDWPIIDFPLRR